MKKGSRLCIYKLKGYIERKHKSTQMAVHCTHAILKNVKDNFCTYSY